MPMQRAIIDAVIKVGVKGIFPSEFGCRIHDEKVVDLMPYFKPKHQLIEHLMMKEDSISWTALCCNPFFDEAVKNTFHGYEPPNKFYLLDGGDAPYGTTNLHTIGSALFKIISDPSHFAESANRYITIYSHITI
ncbi:uncharacterized protein Z518_09444 [Rhinocladiella mackenziei CBS 650.93]|uniref:NmrA-like domain-containing protein n=1 Tax=Rhinocladiella mackenziei CBS 650.93 TaxID=1442369 RepID=A0A0D2GTQ8_9EURO|nr:uncharacterized protein Z518_09444 [Rhinocladiella mackenziei CBS 650.93]KIX01718.1 hypothetical protein Z518_09444 [Rhinocladiella mackenziei CBS 650.93]